MSKISITELLAEINTIEKRIVKKQEFVQNHLLRQEALKDPLEKAGGSFIAIEQETQAISDLHKRKVTIRTAIAKSNLKTTVVVGRVEQTVAEWLIWRREVLPVSQAFAIRLARMIEQIRTEAMKKGYMTVAADADARPGDVVVHLEEMELKESIEALEEIAGDLDGKLSLLNATTVIDL